MCAYHKYFTTIKYMHNKNHFINISMSHIYIYKLVSYVKNIRTSCSKHNIKSQF